MLIFRYFWSIWCAVWFCLSGTVAVIGYRVILGTQPTDDHIRKALLWSQRWAYWLLIGMGIRVRVHNVEAVKPYSKAIFVSNHQSFFDIPVCALANPHIFRFLSKSEIQSMPFVGYVLKRIYYSVDRKSAESRKQSMLTMAQGIQSGFPVHLYIEGTRNPNPVGFLPFQKGAATLSLDHNIPIVPLYIHNSRNFLASKSFKGIGMGTIHVKWGNAIHPAHYSSIQAINQAVLAELEYLQSTL